MGAYRHFYAAFDRLVLCAPFMVEEMLKRAELGKVEAEAIAPDATPFGVGFKYSFEVSAGVGPRPNDGKRAAYGELKNTDPDARYIEFGTSRTPAHRTLRKAMQVMGN